MTKKPEQKKARTAQELIRYVTGKAISVVGGQNNSRAVNKLLAYLGGAGLENVWRNEGPLVNGGNQYTTMKETYPETLYKKSYSLYNNKDVPYEDFKNIVQCYNWGKYNRGGTSISNPILKTEYQDGITDVLKEYSDLHDDAYYNTNIPIIEMLKGLKDKKYFRKNN